jgi:hypothetical protein
VRDVVGQLREAAGSICCAPFARWQSCRRARWRFISTARRDAMPTVSKPTAAAVRQIVTNTMRHAQRSISG